MNSRIASVVSAVRSLADACAPVKREWKVKYFKRVPHPTQPNMFDHVWTIQKVWAYNREEAAKLVNPKLKPAKNCYVTRVMPSEIEEEEGV